MQGKVIKIKGTGLVSTREFIRKTFGEGPFEEWLTGLPEKTEYAFRFPIASAWYPLLDVYLVAARRFCDMFFAGEVEAGARHWGDFNARRELTTVYKDLLKTGAPNVMIAAAAKTWRAYYSIGSLVPSVNRKGYAVLTTHDVQIPDPLWGHHTAGWLETALTLTGAKRGRVTVEQIQGRAASDFTFTFRWA